jgi:hypothetical protein
MGGRARGKRLIVMVLLGLLLSPAPAEAKHRKSSTEWVRDQRDKKRERTYKHRPRHEHHRHHRGQGGYGLVYRGYRPRHEKHRHHHHGHGGYGLVYGGHRPRPRPRPHPCGSWFYDGRPYGQIRYHQVDEFWYFDDDWRPCGPGQPQSSRATYVVHLSGDQVDPPGPSDASGVANLLSLRQRFGLRHRLCYRMALRGSDTSAPLQVHLHRGRAGQSGNVVLNLDLPRGGGGACRDADRTLMNEIRQRPGSFYLDVHTRTHDSGVVRGQLTRAY